MPDTSVTSDLHACVDIAASPASVWQVISDVRRTGEWSPECVRVIPLGGSRRPGTLLLGFNRRAHIRWATLSRLTHAEPERRIAWRVLTNRAVWSYQITPTEHGCRLRETRETPHGVGAGARWFTRSFLGGEAAHDRELETGMLAGLQRIKAVTEH